MWRSVDCSSDFAHGYSPDNPMPEWVRRSLIDPIGEVDFNGMSLSERGGAITTILGQFMYWHCDDTSICVTAEGPMFLNASARYAHRIAGRLLHLHYIGSNYLTESTQFMLPRLKFANDPLAHLAGANHDALQTNDLLHDTIMDMFGGPRSGSAIGHHLCRSCKRIILWFPSQAAVNASYRRPEPIAKIVAGLCVVRHISDLRQASSSQAGDALPVASGPVQLSPGDRLRTAFNSTSFSLSLKMPDGSIRFNAASHTFFAPKSVAEQREPTAERRAYHNDTFNSGGYLVAESYNLNGQPVYSQFGVPDETKRWVRSEASGAEILGQLVDSLDDLDVLYDGVDCFRSNTWDVSLITPSESFKFSNTCVNVRLTDFGDWKTLIEGDQLFVCRKNELIPATYAREFELYTFDRRTPSGCSPYKGDLGKQRITKIPMFRISTSEGTPMMGWCQSPIITVNPAPAYGTHRIGTAFALFRFFDFQSIDVPATPIPPALFAMTITDC